MFFSQKGIVAILLVANSVLTENLFASASFPKPGEEDVVIWNGNWGGWKGMKGPSSGGYYACGAELRIEDSQGGGDDTAANGLELTFCHLANWRSQVELPIHNGNWGGWKGMKMCPYGYYIDGARVRYENPIDGDDTALNGLKIRCRDPKSNRNQWVTVHTGMWGDWKPAITNANKFVSAAEVRFEDSQGDGDDTAMNGLKFQFSEPTNGISQIMPAGEWVNNFSGDNIRRDIKVSMTWKEGQSVTQEKTSSLEMSVSAGFEFKGFSASTTVTGKLSQSVSSTMSSSFSKTTQEGYYTDCSSLGPGLQVLWQWKMEQPSDAFGPGFECMSNQYRCTRGVHLPPRCPLGACKDLECQECVGFDDEF